MAIVVKDRVQETTSTVGTGSFDLGGAVLGFQPFSAIGPTHVTYYACTDPVTGDWEVGIGTYTSGTPDTLSRDTVLSSSAAGAKISFASGSKNVFCTYPAEKAIYEEPSGNTLIDGGPLTIVGANVSPGYTTFSAALAEMYGNVPSFAQAYARNFDTDPEASADFIVYRDNTVDENSNFLDMGINSEHFSSATWPIFTQGSMYLYGNGGEMFIGSETSDVVFFAGGVQTTDEVGRFSATTGELTLVNDLNVTTNVNAAGGTFTAPVTTSSSMTSPAADEFVTKQYVDTATSTGIHIHTPCASETSAALAAVYTQGGTTFNITDITGGNTVVTSSAHGLSVNDEIWLYSTAGNGLSINTPYFVYATPTTTSLQLSTSYGGILLTGLTNSSGLTYATRANSGVGAYLESSANATLPVSGVTVGDRVLVYQQATGYWNGIYTVTSLGSGSTKWKLTRATDANKYEPDNTAGMGAGDYFFIQSNSESYVLTDPVGAIIIGYDAITYTLFSSVPSYIVDSPLQLVGNELSLTTVPATLGGTGYSSYTVGQTLYADTTTTLAKLNIGTLYNVMRTGAGGIPEWGAVNLASSDAVSGTLAATNGGTGQNTYATGDLLYSSASNTLSKLSGNTTTTKKFLGQTGTGSGSAAPVWEQPAASDITGLAPSATTDTTNASNITSGTLPSGRLSGSYTGITGVGTLAAGTWNANTVAAGYGGTGLASYTVGDILYASGTTTLSALADVAVGNALISGGVASAPSWGKIGLTTHVSGILPIANGGTGNSSGQAASVANAVTFNTTGGAAAGTSFDGSAARTIDYSTVGASPLAGSSSLVTVGTVTSGTWNANAVGVGYGGTGIASYTIGDLIYASGTTTLSKLADVATGNALISGGVGVAPSWGKVGLTTHVSGILPTANGGTGNSSGQAASVANAVTFNNSGSGDASGTTFDGSAAKTLSYNTIGASPLAGSSSIVTVGTVTSGTWNGSTIDVSHGGTGSTSLTANNVLLGNGTSAFQTVAPGTTGNVLTSNGTTWTSAAPGGGSSFPSGTLMLFVQTSAPTGWTKSTANDNKALRVVSGTAGTGGTVAFTTAFASGLSDGATTLSTSQIPSHSHFLGYKPSYGYSYIMSTNVTNGYMYSGTSLQVYTQSAGGGGSHTHTLPSFDVQYVDVIIATKN